MQVAVRPYVTTGIALVGASVIAVTPISVAPPEIEKSARAVSTAAVELTAVTNPITAWLDVLTSAVGNAGAIGEEWLTDPAPLLRQFLTNQLGYAETALAAGQGAVEAFVQYISPANEFGLIGQIQTALGELTSGNVAGAVSTLAEALILGPILNLGFPLLTSGLLEVPVTMAENFAKVVTTLLSIETALPLALGGLGSIVGPINAFGDSIQAVVNAVGAGDPIGAIGAFLSAPAVITGALLNGYTNLEGTVFPGLLTFGEDAFSAGLLQTLFVTLPRAIAAAITPEAPPAPVVQEVDAVTETARNAAFSVTLDVNPASTEGASAEAATATDPEPSAPPAAESGEEGEDPTDATEETEDGATETEDGAGDESDGSTDLTDGNKVEPGDTVDDGTAAGDDDTTGGDEDVDTGTEADTEADADAADAADAADGADGGTDGGDAGGDTGSGGDE